MSDDGWMSKSADDDKILYQGEWLSVRQTPGGYDYMHQEKSNGQAVAVLAYKMRPLRIVGRYEECPPHRDGIALCAITGMMDQPGESPVNAAVRELKEEAGIIVGATEMRDLGTVRPSKAEDTFMHLFSVDIGDRDIGKSVGDGTRGEEGAHCLWIYLGDALRCKDPLLPAMLTLTFGIRL